MGEPICIDFETFYSSKLKYSLTGLIAENYVQHHLFEPYMISVYDGKQSWVGDPRKFNWSALDGQHVIAHNAYFEQSVTKELLAREWIPKINVAKWSCTANLTSFLCQRRNLAAAMEKLYGIKVSKDARGSANNKHWPADFSEAEQKAMVEYAQRDAVYAWRIFNDHSAKWPHVEQELSRITIEQGLRGVKINRELLDLFICQSHEMLKRTEDVIPWIKDAEDEEWEDFFDESNMKKVGATSTKCIAEQCRRSGIPCAPVKSEDEEAYEVWENTFGPSHPWIAALGSWRSINKLYKTFLVMKSRLRSDDTMPFALLYFGAHTGRWSATAKVNFQNQRKKPIFCNEYGLLEVNEKRTDEAMKFRKKNKQWPDWVKFAIDFRNLIIPRSGKKMIVSDLSQIEPRCLAWLTKDTTLFEMLKRGLPIYEGHARNTMNWVGSELLCPECGTVGCLKHENETLYALAKVRVLGLGYGAGWEKFITMAAALSGGQIDLTKDDPKTVLKLNPRTGQMEEVSGYGETSKKIVMQFRESNPGIVNLWKGLDEAMKRSVGGDFVMTLPSGRRMVYENVRAERRIEPDPETKQPRSKSVYTVGIGNKRVITYGGKLTENLVQATARDVFGNHVVNMDARGWTNLFSVHDEAVLEVPENVTANDVKQEMSRCPEWLEGCPIGADAKEVPYYQK